MYESSVFLTTLGQRRTFVRVVTFQMERERDSRSVLTTEMGEARAPALDSGPSPPSRRQGSAVSLPKKHFKNKDGFSSIAMLQFRNVGQLSNFYTLNEF